MAKFFGKIGYGESVQVKPGVWQDKITERSYYGDVTRMMKQYAGCAFGIERIFMVLNDNKNIRDIVAFPKNGSGVDLMMSSPSVVDPIQLEEAHLQIVEDEE